jgi:peptide/nickel transport system permease protein
MSAFIVRRLFQAALVLLVMSLLVFVGIFAVGDPIDILINPDATQAQIDAARVTLGLDRPLYEQYLHFLRNALSGDLGNSFVYNRPALDLVFERMPATLELAAAAMLLAILIGVPLGVHAGLHPDKATSKVIMAGSIFGFSVPSFWIGIMMIMLFSVYLGWLPATGRGQVGEIFGIETSLATVNGWKHLLLPALNLALFKVALAIRLTRASMTEVMGQEFIRFARAKGLRERRVVWVYGFRHVMIPLITVMAMEFGSVLAFAVVTETIFAWPGMGKLIIDSINLLDRPVVVAYLLVTAMIFVVLNLLADLSYAALDPRLRVTSEG